MNVAWLADCGNQDGTIGGAELTQAEFKAAAPAGVTVVDVAPDTLDLIADCDLACVFNCVTYPAETIDALAGKPVVRYWNDQCPHGSPQLTGFLLANATNVFCSPLHRDSFPHLNGASRAHHHVIPPPVDLDRFRKAAEASQERSGAVSVAAWMNPGKAPHLVAEWAAVNGGIEFYGTGPYAPKGTSPVSYEDMPALLASYERFVFLPTALEPFGRLVAEAHAAGCEVVTNSLVGATYWLQENPGAIETATADFWALHD